LTLNALQAAVDELKERKRSTERERAVVDTLKEVVELNLERFRNRVKLNVGGTRFETTLATLQAQPESMLGTMFSGHAGIHVPTDEDGFVFIDRSGTHFGAILYYLRTGALIMPAEPSGRQALRLELPF
jgi:hypothetical protein